MNRAIENAQQARSLDTTIQRANEAQVCPEHIAVLAQLRLQVHLEQLRLLENLRRLGQDSGSGIQNKVPTAAPELVHVAGMLPEASRAGPDAAQPKEVSTGPKKTKAGKAAKAQQSEESPKVVPASDGSQPSAAPKASGKQVQTLSSSLQSLSNENPACLFIVRRINKLGFKAARTLKRYFSTLGPVVRVLVAHSTVKAHGDQPSHARRRPSSLGFVHMENAEAVARVLALGEEQEVDGTRIRVQKFERQHADAIEDAEGSAAADEAEQKLAKDEELSAECNWQRYHSAGSEASTSVPMANAFLDVLGASPEDFFEDVEDL